MSYPTVTNIRRHNGVAGQFSYTATVQYAKEVATRIEFVGNAFGGSPILIMGNGAEVYVRPSGRFADFATLNPQWVKDFFKTEETTA